MGLNCVTSGQGEQLLSYMTHCINLIQIATNFTKIARRRFIFKEHALAMLVSGRIVSGR